jgi:hypothetical protein
MSESTMKLKSVNIYALKTIGWLRARGWRAWRRCREVCVCGVVGSGGCGVGAGGRGSNGCCSSATEAFCAALSGPSQLSQAAVPRGSIRGEIIIVE